MSSNKKLAKKRERKKARRAERRNEAISRQHPRAVARSIRCFLCDVTCANDGVEHGDPDCGHGYVVCPVCAVQSCEDCVSQPAIIERAQRRDPAVPIRLDPILVKRLTDKLGTSMMSYADVAAPSMMFMQAPVPCGEGCAGSMIYVEGSERMPTPSEYVVVPGAAVSYDRRCTTCGRVASSTMGAPVFDFGFDDDDDDDGDDDGSDALMQ